MNTSREMFLLTVEEMSFTNAAKKAFITQQCLSSHIKKLEDEYAVKLFERKPKLALTKAGESLYYSLRKIQIAEQAIKEKLIDIKEGLKGEIILGINSSRVRILLPRIYAAYHQRFPKVKISIIMDDMLPLSHRLLDGKIDLLLGVDCVANKNFNFQAVAEDEVFMVATDTLLEKYADTPEHYRQTLVKGVIDLHNFPKLPTASNFSGSTLSNLVERYHNYFNIPRNVVLSVSDSAAQISLCTTHQIGAFVPKSMLQLVMEYNRAYTHAEPLKIFKLKGIKEKLRIDFVTNKYSFQPFYMEEFIKLFELEYTKYLAELDKELW